MKLGLSVSKSEKFKLRKLIFSSFGLNVSHFIDYITFLSPRQAKVNHFCFSCLTSHPKLHTEAHILSLGLGRSVFHSRRIIVEQTLEPCFQQRRILSFCSDPNWKHETHPSQSRKEINQTILNIHTVPRITGEHTDLCDPRQHAPIRWHFEIFGALIGQLQGNFCLNMVILPRYNCDLRSIPLWSFDSCFNRILFWTLLSISSTSLPASQLAFCW